ncbi:hypothetical protein C0Q70_07007 [Pomacea canaliculata]|uniref:Uncharacterized protein n=1 Tax=Pomacea canaliculata TaxID=400727 RepID=A0A2T7PDU5_POMCA|nr:hypothetical protein C0Q70_07007 [Pomacea canaliculata]
MCVTTERCGIQERYLSSRNKAHFLTDLSTVRSHRGRRATGGDPEVGHSKRPSKMPSLPSGLSAPN